MLSLNESFFFLLSCSYNAVCPYHTTLIKKILLSILPLMGSDSIAVSPSKNVLPKCFE